MVVCSCFDVCWSFGVAGCSGIRVAGWSLQHGYHSNPATLKLHHTSKPEHTTNVVIQQRSRKLLMMDILMSETCWTHKKWNKITSDIKLVFYSSNMLFNILIFRSSIVTFLRVSRQTHNNFTCNIKMIFLGIGYLRLVRQRTYIECVLSVNTGSLNISSNKEGFIIN